MTDYFGPSEEKYLTLKDLGMNEEDVVWVSEDTPAAMGALIKSMGEHDMMAIDTESIVGKTKLDKKENQ